MISNVSRISQEIGGPSEKLHGGRRVGGTLEADREASSVSTVQYISSTLSHQSPSRAKTGRAARCVSLVSMIRVVCDFPMQNIDVHLCPRFVGFFLCEVVGKGVGEYVL